MKVFVIMLLLLAPAAHSADLDFSKCLTVKSAQVINYESKSCKISLCLMKIECDFGQGPVVITSACPARTSGENCPTAQECIRDSTVSVKELDEGGGTYMNGSSSGNGRSQVLGL